MFGSEHKLLVKGGWNQPTSSTAVAARSWNNFSGDLMRPQIVAWIVRCVLIFCAILLMLFLWYGTGAERAPIGLLIGIVIGGFGGLWWMETKVQNALRKALAKEED